MSQGPHLSAFRESFFPHLKKTEYRVTGPEDPAYNCIAHAVAKNSPWWWPKGEGAKITYWPEGVPREETLEAFIAAFATEGYSACEELDLGLEVGYEKVVLYVDVAGEPTRAARQLDRGHWTSKLGDWEVIEHELLSSLEAGWGKPAYGRVVKVLKRRRKE